ncbi:hypothetical protein V6N11_048008 [Hibiscus sabdariffa]|uniref:Uncharacterized protein n=1 Tax=Hibiscus sabdariffa TaxID=183260 RepID=A0ABR2NXF4_9ROSI
MNRKDIFDFQKISIRIYVELILSMNRHRVQVKELLDKWWKPVQKTWPSSIFRIGKVWHLQVNATTSGMHAPGVLMSVTELNSLIRVP